MKKAIEMQHFLSAGAVALRVALVATGLVCAAAPGARADWNEPNVEGAREHPLVKFYPQARVYEYDVKDFDGVELVTGYDKAAETPATREEIEGRVTRYKTEHKPRTSALEIVRQYEGALKKSGLTVIVAGKGAGHPGLPIDDDDAFGAFRLDRDGKPAAYVNVEAMSAHTDPPVSYVTIVELRDMEQQLEAGSADKLFAALESDGRVPVYGINFDTGRASIRPESAAVLGTVKDLLASHGELTLRIEGHTDNVGSAAANRKLSEERAAAVRSWLVKNGIDGKRLKAAGFGDTQPVADNADEDGRAKNRRVELVRQ
jgi:outer membrane protein OmpA-like peptidoglycan-associated protein